MEGTPHLHDTLEQVLRQHQNLGSPGTAVVGRTV
jgi:hypothetical protein